jgi:hypothetical protein
MSTDASAHSGLGLSAARATASDALSRRGLFLMIHGAVVAFAAALLAFGGGSLPLYGGGAAVLATFPALAYLEGRSASRAITPLSLFFFWHSIGVGASAIYTGFRVDSEVVMLGYDTIEPHDMSAGYVIYLVGTLAFHAGLQLARPSPRDAEHAAPPMMSEAVGFFALWLVGVALRFFSPGLGFGAIYGWGSLAALSGFALASARRGTLDRRAWTLLAAGCAIEVLINIRSGSKAYIMFSFLPVVWPLVATRGLRRWLGPAIFAVSAFYFGIVYPVVTMTRLYAAEESREDPIATFYSVMNDSSLDRESDLDSPGVSFLQRHYDPESLGYIYGEVQRHGFMDGEGLEYLSYAFVPRFLWPDKPTVTRGAWFTYYLGLADSPEEATAAIGQSATGELYWNYGIPGVITGMLVLGSIIGGLWRVATTEPETHPLKMLLYVSLFFGVIDQAEAGSAITGNVLRFLVVGLPILLLNKRATSRSASAT